MSTRGRLAGWPTGFFHSHPSSESTGSVARDKLRREENQEEREGFNTEALSREEIRRNEPLSHL